MSFILDALKKSEAQRQRADAPALYEMKMAPPRQGVPVWLLVLGGLLIINIGVLAVVLLRGNHSAAPQADATGGAPAAPAVMTPAPAAANPPVANAPATPAGGSAAPNSAAGSGDRADDAPAVESAPAATNGVNSGDVPTYDQAASAPGANLPELKLDLHAYASNPADRFVFLNMTKLKEGQSSPTGVRVESITPDGAILSWQGSRFFLQRQ
jgi:general secretion pathway protein B